MDFPFSRQSTIITPRESQKTEASTFPEDFCAWNFLVLGQPKYLHSMDCCFVSGSYKYNQVSSMVTTRFKKSVSSWKMAHLWSAFKHFGVYFAENFFISKSAWMMWCTRSQEIFSDSDICFMEIQRSDKIRLSINIFRSGYRNRSFLVYHHLQPKLFPFWKEQPNFLQWRKKDKFHQVSYHRKFLYPLTPLNTGT